MCLLNKNNNTPPKQTWNEISYVKTTSAEASPKSRRGMLWHTGCSRCCIRKRKGPLWRACLSSYSISSPTRHFGLQIKIFEYKNITRVFWESFLMTFYFRSQKEILGAAFQVPLPEPPLHFLHRSWWIFLSLEDSSSCGFKKNTKYCETTQ